MKKITYNRENRYRTLGRRVQKSLLYLQKEISSYKIYSYTYGSRDNVLDDYM